MKNTIVVLLSALLLCACGEETRIERALKTYDKPGSVTVPLHSVAAGRGPAKSRQITAGIVLSKRASERKYADEIDYSKSRFGSGGEPESIMDQVITLKLRNADGSINVDCDFSVMSMYSYGSDAEKGAYLFGNHPVVVAATDDLIVVSFAEAKMVDGTSTMSGCKVLQVANKDAALPEEEE